jgi:transposase
MTRRPSAGRPPRTAPPGAVHRTHHLGPHPIIAHFLERLTLDAIIRGCVGSARQGLVDHARTLAVLVHNLLVSPGPLYRIATWLAPVEAAALGLTPTQGPAINDDRVARALDALTSERGRSIWFRLALRIIKQFELETQRFHHDTTTVTFHGRYATSHEAPQITHGHNKDHRPDLKQLVFGLTATADGAVPVWHDVFSGNRTDDTVHRSTVDALRAIVGRAEFIYVADCKLCTADNLRHIAQYGGQFVTVMPRTWKEDQQFRTRLRDQGIRWHPILTIPNRRRQDDPPDIFSTCAGPYATADGYRIIWMRSSQKAAEDARTRERRLAQAQAALRELNDKLARRRDRTRPAIQRAVAKILRETDTRRFLLVTIHRHVEQRRHYLSRGRPTAETPVQVARHITYTLAVRRDGPVLARERRVDGVFPLVTNLVKAPKREVLSMYKFQPYVERRFALVKTDLEIAPVYLKKPRRVAGLLHAYFIALAVASLIEREVRNGMRRQGLKTLTLLPENRPTATPTCPRILEAFRDVRWYEVEHNGEVMFAFPIELSKLQRTLLELLGVPAEAYQ